MDLAHMLFDGLIWFASNQSGQSLLEPIGFFEAMLLSVFSQGAAVELGLDPAHGRREAVLAVVAVGIASLRFA